MLPLRVDYVPGAGFQRGPAHLGIIAFDAAVPGADLVLPVSQLGEEALTEVWTSPEPVERGSAGAMGFARNAEVLFGTIASDDDAVEEAARRAYEEIVSGTRAAGYPHLLRVWNHVRGLNEGDGDSERYRRFCAGRHDALVAAGFDKRDFPAACAVGMLSGGLSVYFIAARSPGVQIENSRQVSAYEYPRRYGPRSPSFARATIAAGTLFIAGTASVVGHETRHAGDVAAQTDETLANLDVVVRAAGATISALTRVKTYLRRRADAPVVAARLRAAIPSAQLLFLESEICRRDLLVEVEGVGSSSL